MIIVGTETHRVKKDPTFVHVPVYFCMMFIFLLQLVPAVLQSFLFK